MVHFAIDENGGIRPLCGEWGDDRSWTRIRGAVTCPRCLALLGDAPEAPHGRDGAHRLEPVFALRPLVGAHA